MGRKLGPTATLSGCKRIVDTCVQAVDTNPKQTKRRIGDRRLIEVGTE